MRSLSFLLLFIGCLDASVLHNWGTDAAVITTQHQVEHDLNVGDHSHPPTQENPDFGIQKTTHSKEFESVQSDTTLTPETEPTHLTEVSETTHHSSGDVVHTKGPEELDVITPVGTVTAALLSEATSSEAVETEAHGGETESTASSEHSEVATSHETTTTQAESVSSTIAVLSETPHPEVQTDIVAEVTEVSQPVVTSKLEIDSGNTTAGKEDSTPSAETALPESTEPVIHTTLTPSSETTTHSTDEEHGTETIEPKIPESVSTPISVALLGGHSHQKESISLTISSSVPIGNISIINPDGHTSPDTSETTHLLNATSHIYTVELKIPKKSKSKKHHHHHHSEEHEDDSDHTDESDDESSDTDED